MKNIRLSLFIMLLLSMVNACSDLEVINQMEPDAIRVLSDTDALMDMAGESFRIIHNQMQEYSGEALNMAVKADHMTMPWGITLNLSRKPRINSYVNNSLYPYYGFQLLPQWEES